MLRYVNKTAFFVLSILVTVSVTAREWESPSGDRAVKATFLKLLDDEVVMQTKSGKIIQIPLTSLRDSDQKYALAQEKIRIGKESATRKPKRAERGPVLTEAKLREHCSPRAIDIEIIGRDNVGLYAVRGAGSIVHESGYILTCEHVTAIGESQNIHLADGTVYPFKVLGRAAGHYDFAILRVEPKKPLPYVTLGHSSDIKVGEKAMIIGNPDGKHHTINVGVINRNDCGGGNQIEIVKAPLGPGDSGGPVFNFRGEQIAHVHTKIHTLKETSRHIQVDYIRTAFAKVFMNEDRYPFAIGIGVECQGDEALVMEVKPGSAAEEAGIQLGDVITKFGDMDIRIGPHYVLALMDRVDGKPVVLKLKRGDQELEKTVTPKPKAK